MDARELAYDDQLYASLGDAIDGQAPQTVAWPKRLSHDAITKSPHRPTVDAIVQHFAVAPDLPMDACTRCYIKESPHRLLLLTQKTTTGAKRDRSRSRPPTLGIAFVKSHHYRARQMSPLGND